MDVWSPSSLQKTAPGAYLTEGWAGHGAGLDTLEKQEISCPYQE